MILIEQKFKIIKQKHISFPRAQVSIFILLLLYLLRYHRKTKKEHNKNQGKNLHETKFRIR